MVCSIIEMLMATVVKLVNTLDCGSSISWVRVPSVARSNLNRSMSGFSFIAYEIRGFENNSLRHLCTTYSHRKKRRPHSQKAGIIGGDCVERIGFGVKLLKIYPETAAGKPGHVTYAEMAPGSLVMPLIIGFVIAFVILQICFKEKH